MYARRGHKGRLARANQALSRCLPPASVRFLKQPLTYSAAQLTFFYEVLQCRFLFLAVDQLLRIQLGASQLDRSFYVASFPSSLLSHLLVRCFTYSTRHHFPSLLVLLVPGCFNRTCGKGGLLLCSAHH